MICEIFCRLLILLAIIGQTGQTCGLFIVHEQNCPESNSRESSHVHSVHIHSIFELLDSQIVIESEDHHGGDCNHIHRHGCHHHDNVVGFIPACSESGGCCFEHSVTVEPQYNLVPNVQFDVVTAESVCFDLLLDYDSSDLVSNFNQTLFMNSPRYISYCTLLI